MNEILVKSGVEIDLGKRGEHLARCIVFDISGWQKTYGDGSVHLLHQRNGDKAPYPCVVETDGPCVRWLLSETDVDVAGRGRAELQYFVGDARVKSETWNTRTNRSMNNEGPIPEEPAENWLNAMLQLGTETQGNAEIAEQSAEIAENSAVAAKASASEAAESAEAAADKAASLTVAQLATQVDAAESAAAKAKTSELNAAESEKLAEGYKQDARGSASLATREADRAADAKNAAEKARDEAQAIAGGDVASTVYVDNQIGAHNSSTSAHVDIRKSIDALTAADVGARPNTWMPTAADVGAAPKGYGLGVGNVSNTGYKQINHEQADNLWNTGVYWFVDASNPMYPDGWGTGGYGLLIHLQHNYNSTTAAKQYFIPYQPAFMQDNANSNNYVVVSRTRRNAGTWTEVEWQNPPMTIGMEFRTTERYLGKPVYAQAVSAGDLEANVSKLYVVDSGEYDAVVRTYANGTNAYNRYCTPYDSEGITFRCSGFAYKVYSGGSLSLRLKLDSSVAMSNVIATVYYTKFTD
jgi:hypothetical protein